MTATNWHGNIDSLMGPTAGRAAVDMNVPAPGFHALFAAGILLAGPLFTYVPYRFVCWSQSLIAEGSGAIVVAAALFLAAVSFIGGVRWMILFVLSYLTFRGRLRRGNTPIRRFPLVSVFVPAHNEAETIEPALASLLKIDYPHYEVLVVDDGSTDDTLARARKFEGRYPRCTLRVLSKPNGGKSSAHNLAFGRARGELILCLDADSRIAPQALRRMVARMQEPGVDGVAGQVRVRNRINAVTGLQALEYIVGNGSVRMAQSHSGTVLVIPGPIGLFRRDVLEEIYRGHPPMEGPTSEGAVEGPFEHDTFAEDFDLSLTLLARGGKVVYEPTAVSNTKGPEGLFALVSQRYRWCRGTIQVLRKYLDRSRHDPQARHPRLILWLAGTYFYDMLLVPLLLFVGLGLLSAGIMGGGDPIWLLAGLVPFLLLNATAAALFTTMHKDDMGMLRYCLVYDVYYGVVMTSVWAIAIFDEVRGSRMRW